MNTLAIGGYFEIELPTFQEFHSNALALNSGRSCIEYILRCRKYSKIYVPYFTCDSTIEPILKLSVPYEFYHIDKEYHIVDNITLQDDEALLYTNYWGMQGEYCKELFQKYGQQLILDYTQAFYAKPILGADTFYSCRKFFGVPDGGYLYIDKRVDIPLEQDISYTRMDSLVKRIDLSPEDGYDDFRKCSESFHGMPILLMSKFTRRMMQSINYDLIAEKRRKNYEFLRNALGGEPLVGDVVPMIFPYLKDGGEMVRRLLIQSRIFVAKYWPNVDAWAGERAIETWMANNILPLPIDQRYGNDEMSQIVELIKTI